MYQNINIQIFLHFHTNLCGDCNSISMFKGFLNIVILLQAVLYYIRTFRREVVRTSNSLFTSWFIIVSVQASYTASLSYLTDIYCLKEGLSGIQYMIGMYKLVSYNNIWCIICAIEIKYINGRR